MSLMQGRGGVPHVFRDTISAAGRAHQFPFVCNFLQVRAESGEAVRVFFTEADYLAGTDYVVAPLPTSTYPYGEWSGPVEVSGVWLKSASATPAAMSLVAYQRRG